jgi:hypothetical protein
MSTLRTPIVHDEPRPDRWNRGRCRAAGRERERVTVLTQRARSAGAERVRERGERWYRPREEKCGRAARDLVHDGSVGAGGRPHSSHTVSFLVRSIVSRAGMFPCEASHAQTSVPILSLASSMGTNCASGKDWCASISSTCRGSTTMHGG